MRFTFATWAMAEYQGHVLTKLGAESRLVSYYEVRDATDRELEDYCYDGKLDRRKEKKVR